METETSSNTTSVQIAARGLATTDTAAIDKLHMQQEPNGSLTSSSTGSLEVNHAAANKSELERNNNASPSVDSAISIAGDSETKSFATNLNSLARHREETTKQIQKLSTQGARALVEDFYSALMEEDPTDTNIGKFLSTVKECFSKIYENFSDRGLFGGLKTTSKVNNDTIVQTRGILAKIHNLLHNIENFIKPENSNQGQTPSVLSRTLEMLSAMHEKVITASQDEFNGYVKEQEKTTIEALEAIKEKHARKTLRCEKNIRSKIAILAKSLSGPEAETLNQLSRSIQEYSSITELTLNSLISIEELDTEGSCDSKALSAISIASSRATQLIHRVPTHLNLSEGQRNVPSHSEA